MRLEVVRWQRPVAILLLNIICNTRARIARPFWAKRIAVEMVLSRIFDRTRGSEPKLLLGGELQILLIAERAGKLGPRP